MNHELIQQKLFALYDGPLTEQERKLVEVHLAQCAECRKAISQWKAISARLFPAQTFSEVAEDAFVAKVMGRVRSAGEKAESWGTLFFRWLVPLAGSAVVAGWVFFSVLSDSSIFSSNSNNLEAAFSSESSDAAGSGNGIMLASYTSSQDIVP